MYRVHPALPGYLAAAWRAADPGGYATARDRGDRAMVAACAALGGWLHQQAESGNAANALAITRLLHRTLGATLGSALDHGEWAEALAITAPLDRYWTADGLNAEAARWTDRICEAIPRSLRPLPGTCGFTPAEPRPTASCEPCAWTKPRAPTSSS
jgi:hypothetical protein